MKFAVVILAAVVGFAAATPVADPDSLVRWDKRVSAITKRTKKRMLIEFSDG